MASGGDASAGQVGSTSDKTFVFVGDKMSGKTSLIAKLLDEPVKEDMKETTALDFRYGTRVKEEKKQKINIYELGNLYLCQQNRWWTHPLRSVTGTNQRLLTGQWELGGVHCR
jgi:GTPase SAR1 family protein